MPASPWPSSVFFNIQIGECLEFDWQVDVLAALDNKAISGPLLSWPREYDSRDHRLRYGTGMNSQNRGPPAEKRLMIEFLKRDHVDVAEEILKYLRRDDKDSHICVMCLKERELNRSKGRFFTKKTVGARLYQVTLEKNMGAILEHVPVTSMKFTGDSLQKYLLTKSRDSSIAKLPIDYSKWCQNQRRGGGAREPYCRSDFWSLPPLLLCPLGTTLYMDYISRCCAPSPKSHHGRTNCR